jgi:hypothetical protein
MTEQSFKSLNAPLLEKVPVRTSFLNTTALIEGDLIAQNIFIDLDKAI